MQVFHRGYHHLQGQVAIVVAPLLDPQLLTELRRPPHQTLILLLDPILIVLLLHKAEQLQFLFESLQRPPREKLKKLMLGYLVLSLELFMAKIPMICQFPLDVLPIRPNCTHNLLYLS